MAGIWCCHITALDARPGKNRSWVMFVNQDRDKRILKAEVDMKILLPVDGSAGSLDAVRFAIRMAGDGLQTSVVLANVQEPSTLYELVVAHDPQVLAEVSAAAGAHTLEAAQTLLSAAGIEFENEVASGDPAHTIIDIVERYGCDMVVMGASGTSTLRSALLGSVSNEVLHAAGVPVVIVKSGVGMAQELAESGAELTADDPQDDLSDA
jgi:nucleotide-binding universal stress UspA family protein